MTKEEFQNQHIEEYRKWLYTPLGQAFLSTLTEFLTPYDFAKDLHLFAENRGSRRGGEHMIRNIIGLAMVVQKKPEVEATYGVPDRKK